ncbi:hypothetical protein ACA910_005224 [Epithemia clementina (nom. ined.)]
MNPYLARREAKIAENEQRLRDLGLLPQLGANKAKPDKTTQSSSPSSVPAESTVIAATKTLPSGSPVIVPVRRSKRLRIDHPSSLNRSNQQTEDTNYEERPMLHRRKANQKKDCHVHNDHDKPVSSTSSSKEKQNHSNIPIPPNSARAIDIDVNCLLFGPDNTKDSGLLGKQLSSPGKAFVMQESVRLAAIGVNTAKPESPATVISFNKYSGVQEWKNGVLFLWVNLNAPQCDVKNEFPGNNGSQITWYGGSRMHDQSPVIQRLIQKGKHSHATIEESPGDHGESFGIVLWCRRYMASKKCFTPYTCLGRLSYSSHEPGSRPLSFLFNLVDHQNLLQHPDSNVRQSFLEIVNATAGRID